MFYWYFIYYQVRKPSLLYISPESMKHISFSSQLYFKQQGYMIISLLTSSNSNLTSYTWSDLPRSPQPMMAVSLCHLVNLCHLVIYQSVSVHELSFILGCEFLKSINLPFRLCHPYPVQYLAQTIRSRGSFCLVLTTDSQFI